MQDNETIDNNSFINYNEILVSSFSDTIQSQFDGNEISLDISSD
jgi:hypothetical protein